jgi:hypothetical protein
MERQVTCLAEATQLRIKLFVAGNRCIPEEGIQCVFCGLHSSIILRKV